MCFRIICNKYEKEYTVRFFQRRFWLLIALPVLLAACTGVGVKGSEEISRSIQTASADSVFFYRVTGFSGSGALINIFIDGKVVGAVGVKESLEVKIPRGTHSVEARYSGIAEATTASGKVTFVQDGQKPHFFLVSQKANILYATVLIVETTASSYASAIQ